ncbi:hypothetical protein [Streptomyces marianii]|uniref:Uncharacterized protein n=1 Tax=Streptomyces marianii TaxID=1817406 RepID=A0A5R9E7P5_9ACTN|nr:hypothetical protein [Streptomyces marianii]TLQ46080.1 hypothetical protein FEF34_26555 [Streptomyces marianii]
MTLVQPPMLTHGGTHPARAFRMMVRDLARGSQGVTEANDLKVRQLSTPGSGVRVGDGSSVIRGASWGQGSYTQYNIGDAIVPVAPTGATGRSDLLVQRIEDPEYEGSRDPAKDDIGYFQVIPNASATATAVPAGMTAIPLARLDIPPNTATITDAMIRDLRIIANPRRSRSLFTSSPSASSTLGYSDNKWHAWPTAARWNIAVPDWATQAKLITMVSSLALRRANVFALMRNVIGGVAGQHIAIDDDQGNGTRRNTIVIADTLLIPAAMRGTTVPVYLDTYMYKSETGDLVVDGATSFVLDVEFSEGVI